MSSPEVEFTRAELAEAVAADTVTPHQLILAWAQSNDGTTPPRVYPFAPETVLVAALPREDVDELAPGAFAVVQAGGRVHCVPVCRAEAVLAEVRAIRATDLVVRAGLLRLIRRTWEAELAAGPLSTLAVFEGLQHSAAHSSRARRALLPDLHARLGSQLITLWCAGEPADLETATFFSRAGLHIRRCFD
ncbi:hypothetical protein [Amycolatopsis sp. H20-H5]|uniref:hypothetical protein n=1 Tax=Amycolatopsis sp. H20-H5 TaxID=3046309 RepID=UPI002DBD4079|nr:hypothetical protein [Amycolatopsis sp. H20-H5]MEC3974272.1 hypothetical protein [Amycolatopsis sp. H20-H5]